MASGKDVAIHFVLMLIQFFGLFYDHKVVSECPDRPKYFRGYNDFGGRFKFLTYLTLLLNSFYFTIAFIVDALNLESLKMYADWMFTTCNTTISYICVVFFWGLFLLDRENIYPPFMDDYLPVNCFINHFWHTWPVIACIIECISLPHHYPPPIAVLVILATFCLLYISCILIVYQMSGYWVYPFMEKFSNVMFFLFFSVSTVVCGLFYITGKSLGAAFGQINESTKQKLT